jgi:hypothetical protein
MKRLISDGSGQGQINGLTKFSKSSSSRDDAFTEQPSPISQTAAIITQPAATTRSLNEVLSSRGYEGLGNQQLHRLAFCEKTMSCQNSNSRCAKTTKATSLKRLGDDFVKIDEFIRKLSTLMFFHSPMTAEAQYKSLLQHKIVEHLKVCGTVNFLTWWSHSDSTCGKCGPTQYKTYSGLQLKILEWICAEFGNPSAAGAASFHHYPIKIGNILSELVSPELDRFVKVVGLGVFNKSTRRFEHPGKVAGKTKKSKAEKGVLSTLLKDIHFMTNGEICPGM